MSFRKLILCSLAGALFSSAIFAQSNSNNTNNSMNNTNGSMNPQLGTQLNPVLEPSQLQHLPYVKLFLEMNAVPMIVWDTQGGLVAANDAYLNMIGYTRDELRSKKIDWVTITPQEYRHFDQTCLDQLKAGQLCDPYVKKYKRKDGKLITVKLWNAREPHGSNIAIILPAGEKIVQ